MGSVHQIIKATSQRDEAAWTIESSQPMETLAKLICQAEENSGNINAEAVLALAAAARAAIDSLLSDMERVDREALQDAVLETFLAKGNA